MFRVSFIYQYTTNQNCCDESAINVSRNSPASCRIYFWHNLDEILAELGISTAQLSFIAIIDIDFIDRA